MGWTCYNGLMDDYDDYGNEYDADYDEDGLEGDVEQDAENELSDEEIVMLASLDGEQDGVMRNVKGSGYGMSADLDKLSDEQRSLYDSEYYAGYDAGENNSLFDDENEDF